MPPTIWEMIFCTWNPGQLNVEISRLKFPFSWSTFWIILVPLEGMAEFESQEEEESRGPEVP